MTSVRLRIDPLQEVRIKKALKKHKGVCIWASPSSDPDGPDVGTWLLSPRQMHLIQQSDGNYPTKLTFSADQLRQNLKHTGGFLPLLASALIPIIGSAVGAVVAREISGGSMPIHADPVYISRPTGTFSVRPQGEGLYLNPYAGRKPRGYGLFQGERSVKHSDVSHPDWNTSHKKILKTLL